MFSTGKVGMTYVNDRNEAEQLVEAAKNLINRAYVYFKTHGKPDPKLIESKREVSLMKIYEKLPKTNCKECGEASCYVFVVKILSGEKDWRQCPHADVDELERMLNLVKI